MVQTLVNGILYDYYESVPTTTTTVGENHEIDHTSLEGRITEVENELNAATHENVADKLVKRQTITYLEDIVSKNLDVEEVVELLEPIGYFYWENQNRNQFIQIGSSILAEDPSASLSGLTHYHQETATVIISGNDTYAPLRIESNTTNIRAMFEVVDSNGEIIFHFRNNGEIINSTIQMLIDKVAELENRIHILESEAGII